MATKMTETEVRDFLTAGTRTGKLATVRADGSPHVVPIWFVLDGDDLVFNTGADTVKGKAILRDPRVAICVDSEIAPFAYVTVRGTATVSTDLPDMLIWATRIAHRYMGADLAEQYGTRNAVDGELLVRVRMARIHGFTGVAS
ncbi:PPOX class F420-dependent oxidoreductase [Actinoplanes derwentensis]|uniref:PPOX class probable F420-dependent enzyme n=1 Tax=Actinoplanes derwentensis TaxID=113562 RepID=A0A1H1W1R6_9ACTN|nr:PPOX class F420-dependent oxidoreductase [Actinoplanes derwentensis]GID84022.1 PPOX class F420-dependent enzyme [Actinoplanes derwentensis]SDS91044.1 PPOX class probable F420-dependent enzyme [Actinoplanes derwentensis]